MSQRIEVKHSQSITILHRQKQVLNNCHSSFQYIGSETKTRSSHRVFLSDYILPACCTFYMGVSLHFLVWPCVELGSDEFSEDSYPGLVSTSPLHGLYVDIPFEKYLIRLERYLTRFSRHCVLRWPLRGPRKNDDSRPEFQAEFQSNIVTFGR